MTFFLPLLLPCSRGRKHLEGEMYEAPRVVEADNLYYIARSAAHSSLSRFPREWAVEDVEDAVQAAAAAAWTAFAHVSRAQESWRGYLYRAARDGATRELARVLLGRNVFAEPLGDRDVAEQGEDTEEDSWDSVWAWRIYWLLRQARKQKRGRAVAGARRDMAIVLMAMAGWSNEGIANELNMTVNAVKVYRERIKRFLATHPRLRCEVCGENAVAFRHLHLDSLDSNDPEHVIPVCEEHYR